MKPSFFFIIIALLFSFCSQTTKSQQTPKTKKSLETNKTKRYSKPLYNTCPPTIKQGLYGCCTYKTGNCMPIIDTNQCKWYGVKRTIFIYEPTKASQAISIDGGSEYFSKITTKLVAQIESDNNGCYQVELPVGQYSILILENGKYYCRSMGDNFLLCPVTVDTNKATKRDLLIKMFVD